MISQEEFATHREDFASFVATIHRFATLLFIISFIGYGAAVWVWFQGATWTALIVATLSYLFFRQFRRLSLNMARIKYTLQPRYHPMLLLVDRMLEDHKPAVVVGQLESLLKKPEETPSSPES
ncbi:hypothetical protein [Ectothiorhodospira lacustris]|uniref:hypothetical protein n=1 Tax=Ectothiorhodospira lacustris TaxID=2899127 RepID=UPI001EE8D195|nr:hypothetical protein [Ectothiorhodospira lacustris]MCG5501480.1 hypothetical protein [Ectothiorhodospira lacustris]MCG5510715.1 hypothetical protein [Ectothiorhodospira lacustris]MCG5522385.1 hypothetical protein [Ectothiorhodospira lacustris]